MTTLTKTEQRIVEHMAQKQRFGAESYHGQGAEGGTVRGGQREFRAAMNLIKKGLARETNRHSTHRVKAGYTVHITSITIEPVGGA